MPTVRPARTAVNDVTSTPKVLNTARAPRSSTAHLARFPKNLASVSSTWAFVAPFTTSRFTQPDAMSTPRMSRIAWPIGSRKPSSSPVVTWSNWPEVTLSQSDRAAWPISESAMAPMASSGVSSAAAASPSVWPRRRTRGASRWSSIGSPSESRGARCAA